MLSANRCSRLMRGPSGPSKPKFSTSSKGFTTKLFLTRIGFTPRPAILNWFPWLRPSLLLFTSLTAFTKTEGLALVFVVFLAIVMAAWLLNGQPVRSLWPLPATALGGLICLTAWFLYQVRLPVVDEHFAKLLTLRHLFGG